MLVVKMGQMQYSECSELERLYRVFSFLSLIRVPILILFYPYSILGPGGRGEAAGGGSGMERHAETGNGGGKRQSTFIDTCANTNTNKRE